MDSTPEDPAEFRPTCTVLVEQLDPARGHRLAASAGVPAAHPDEGDDGRGTWHLDHGGIHGGLVPGAVLVVTGPRGDRWEVTDHARTHGGAVLACESVRTHRHRG